MQLITFVLLLLVSGFQFALNCVLRPRNRWRILILGVIAGTSAVRAESPDAVGPHLLRIASSASYETLDPHLGFDWLSYPTLNAVCANLTLVEENTESFEYDLAESIELLDEGRLLKIQLLKGIVFHDARPVTAADVVYSLNRMLSSELNSPGAPMFSNIVGFEQYRAGETEQVAGVRLLGEYELEIELVRPSASFFLVLATNFGCVFPEGHDPEGLEIPISAGPFFVETLTEEGVLIMNRVPEEANHYGKVFDRIEVYSELPTDVHLAKYSNKEIDIIIDGLPWEAINASYTNAPLHALEQAVATTYLTLNTQIPPFDDQKVRQAVNFAINRESLIDIMKGATASTTQIIPPGIQGYVPNKKKYYYDPSRARELLAGVGTLPIKTNLYAVDDHLYRRLVVSMVSDLRKVGIIVTPYFGTHEQVLEIASSAEGAQMVYSDGLGWIADFPDPANFYFPLFTDEARVVGGWNWAKYYNEEVDKMAMHAESIIEPERQIERRDMWRAVYDKIEEESPWVPLYNRGSNHTISFEALDYIQSILPYVTIGFSTQFINKWR